MERKSKTVVDASLIERGFVIVIFFLKKNFGEKNKKLD